MEITALEPRGLVHELYLLPLDTRDRKHFFAIVVSYGDL